MSHNIKHTEEKHKKHKNTMKNFLQVNRALAAEKNFRLVNRALAAEKNYYFLSNLYAKILQKIGGGTSRHKASIIAKQFSQYCVSQSEGAQGKNLDEKAQLSPSCPLLASSLRLTCSLQLRRIALIFAVLVMSMANVGMAWGDDYTIALTSFTESPTGTYTNASLNELKCIKYTNILVEVPSASVSGTVSWVGSGSANDRFLYLYKTNGTVKDETRKIVYAKSYGDVDFTSSDIKTSGGKYYLVFGTTDDWKAAGVKYTLAAPSCTAPTGLSAGSLTAKGATFTVTDAANTNNYEFYVSKSSTAPAAETEATYTSTDKIQAVTDLVAGTQYYAWVRSKCSASNKSDWVSGGYFTTNTVTVTHTLTNVTKTSGAESAGGSDYTAEFAAVSGYSMPTPTVTIDGNTATSGMDYTWSSGTLTIPANKINGIITITVTGVAKTTTITIDANTSNHGSTAPSPITATYSRALPSFTPAAGIGGWNLTGYFTEAIGGTKIINADGTLVASTDYADGDGKWKYETATLTLYAQYEKEGCTPTTLATVTLTGGDSKLSVATTGCSESHSLENSKGVGGKIGNSGYLDISGLSLKAGDKVSVSIKIGDYSASALYMRYGDHESSDIQSAATGGSAGSAVVVNFTVTKTATAISFARATGSTTGTASIDNQNHILKSITITRPCSEVYAINEGSHTNGTIAITDGSSAITEAEEGATVHISATPNTGYNFTSWSVTKTASGDAISLTGTNPATFTMPAEAVTVAATFTLKTYTITAAVNDGEYGSVSPASIAVDHGSTISISDNVLTCNAKTLTATATTATAQYTYAFNNWTGVTNGATVTSNFTATANFTRTANSYTLTWDLAGGTVTTAGTGAALNATGSPSGSVNYGTTVTAPVVTKAGYTFNAWSPTVVSPMPDEDKTYTATWTAIVPSSVSLNKTSTTITEGDIETLTATVLPDNALDKSITWTTSNSSIATVDGGVVTGVASGSATITATTVNGKKATCAVTVAAAVTYTVTYDAQGGTCKASDTGSSITLATPTKSGYTFQGWYTSGGTLISGTYNPTADITLYALWREDECSGGGGGSSIVYSMYLSGTNGNSDVTITQSTADVASISNVLDNSSPMDVGGLKYFKFGTSSSITLNYTFVAGDKLVFDLCSKDDNKNCGVSVKVGSADAVAVTGTINQTPSTLEYTMSSAGSQTIVIKRAGDAGSAMRLHGISITRAGSGTCYYVTYNGNGADGGFTTDEASHPSGSDVTVKTNAFTKTGYRFNGWNTAANGSGTSYAVGGTIEGISANVTLYAQWVLDACSAPAAPTISGTASSTEGQTITLTATCASGADASTTYTWYKGETFGAAEPVQAAMTAGAGGTTFTKASCAAGDAGKYWCKASNGIGCEAHNETGFTVTVSAAVEEHIYYYKDANHYSEGTYSNPEGNTASKGDNHSLSTPWMICNGCIAGVDSVVAHGATYDGKGNHMNAYIKLPTGGDATTKNIKFALAEGYTGTLTMKIGGYASNPTVTLQPLNTSTGELGDAILYSGTVSGVATTEDNFGEITWNLSNAGGTYILTVSSANAYISQIDMTTETSAKFKVTYDGNGKTGGTVPTDETNYSANASVTVQSQGTMVKDNYTFGGWNTANNGTGTNYVAGSGTFSIKGATTLYAHWTQSITLAPGAQGSGTNGATVSWNGTAVRGFTAHTAAGYSLTGYYTATSGGTKVLNSDGTFAATNIDGYITDGKWSRTGAEATLYAQWSGSAIVTNTLGVGSSNKWSSAISTTAPLQITKLSALAAVGGLAIEDEKGTSADGRALTCKVEASGATSKTDGRYLQLSFSIAAGYKLRVTGLDVTVRSVSKAGKYHLELVGTTGILIPDDEQVASGAVNTIFDDAYNVELTGDVTLKLWAYGQDESNLMAYYRLGSPIAIYGAVEESCTPPTFSGLAYSATEYTQGTTASAISVTGAANVDSYQWKYNAVNDRTSGTNCGTGASVTPSTASTGTLYYWCELKNTCTTVKTSAVAVTVSALASNPNVTWSDVKLNGEVTTVNYGGGNYTLRATVNEPGWSGTMESSMVTAPAGIYIHHIGTGMEDGKKYIEFHFDVTTAFDRAANETIGFYLSLPAISGTPNWNALTSDKLVSYTACDEGEGQVAIPLTATAQTSASNPQNYWEVAEAGKLAYNYGSEVAVLQAATAYKTSDVDFDYYVAETNKTKWMFQPYIAGVNKVRVAFRAAGNLSSGQASVSKFYYDTEYFASPGSHENLIGDVSANQATYTSGENGYIEFTVPEMAANSYGAFELLDNNIEIYGIVLFSENAGSGGTIETNPAWSGGLANDGTAEVNKSQGDANFTYTISTTTNTLGGITYSSSNPSVAEVNATTGEVRITATGNTEQTAVITATLARSGCYQPAKRTYTVRVAGQECTITSAGTLTADKTSKCESDNVVLSLSGHDTDGTTVTWYRDETDVTSSVSNNTLTTSTPGAYSVVVLKSACSLRSNTVNITNISAETSATKIVDKWYIKNGRLTPDIALWRLDEGTTFKSVAWSPANSTGLNFDIRDGIVYLEGKEPSANETGADIVYTLTLTITDICGTDHELTDKTITLTHQKNTDKHVLAFVVGNTEKQNNKYVAIGKGFTESISALQTTNVGLYNEIAKNFYVQPTNIYSTDDEQKIKEYYSQFDIICITDYPNTQTKGSHSVSYSDAIGVMVDIRPVLTMEAWVSGLSNWNKKGISGNPKNPTTRQYTMELQCKDHEIFAGTTLTEVGEGDEKMYRVTMVDKNQEEYKTLDANYGDGEHKSNEGYQYGKKPALQGFTYTEEMSDNDLLPLGLIDDGTGNDLQVGLERQREMSARMMVLGINSYAMERLTDDGERIVINALKYLMKKNAEDIADCSTSFVGGADKDPTNWRNADNWTGNTVPDKTQKVRILAPCVVPEGERAHVAGVLIAPNDGGTYNGGSTPTTGSLTIAAGGALVVEGKIQAVTAPAYNRPRATTPADLTILTDADAQGALIFDNSEGETQATVQMYSPSYWEIMEGTNKKKSYWSYVAIPIQDAYVGEFFYGAVTYLYDETEGWIRKRIGTHLHAFEGIGLSLPEGHTETFYGPLAPTEDRTVTLTKTTSGGNGENLIGNSWTAPIQIANFEASDFGSATQNVMIYSTGRDGTQDGKIENAEYVTATVENDGNVNAGQWISIPINVPSLDGYDGLKVIPAMQAFQVTTGTETSLTLNYDKLVRDVNIVSDNLTEKQHAPARRSSGAKKSLMSTMRVRVSGVKTRTDVWLLEDDRFSEAFDNGWEAKYAECDDRSAQLYAQSETGNMSFLAKSDIEGTVLGFAPSKDGNQYLFTFHYVGDDEYYLNDLKLTTATLISAENSYLFTYEEGDTNRFYISRQPLGAPAVATGVDNPREEAKPRKFIYNDKMYILFNGRVFDATGKVVK